LLLALDPQALAFEQRLELFGAQSSGVRRISQPLHAIVGDLLVARGRGVADRDRAELPARGG